MNTIIVSVALFASGFWPSVGHYPMIKLPITQVIMDETSQPAPKPETPEITPTESVSESTPVIKLYPGVKFKKGSVFEKYGHIVK